MTAGTASASGDGSGPYDIRGQFPGTFTSGGSVYQDNLTVLTENLSTGAFTGIDNSAISTISGTVTGRHVALTIVQGGYVAKGTLILSVDGTTLTGPGSDNNGVTGNFAFHWLGSGGAKPGTGAADHRAGATKGPAPIATALPTPSQVFSSPAALVASAGVTIAGIVLITFPANLFNKTFEENYDEIRLWWEPLRRRFRRTTPAAEDPAAGDAPDATHDRDRLVFAATAIAGAVLGGLLNPAFGANSASAAGFTATLLSIAVGTLVGALVGDGYRRARHYDRGRRFQALPAGLVVAAACMLLSRVTHFQPGYLYGVVCGVAFTGTLTKKEDGHMVALTHLASIGVSVLAWFAWVPVNHLTLNHPGIWPLVVIDDLLASIFVGGLVGGVINLIPVRFMPGHALAKWHRGMWAAVFGLATFGLVAIVVRPALHKDAGTAPLVTIIVLFVFFGGGSVAFREYFARKQAREAVEDEATPATAEAAVPVAAEPVAAEPMTADPMTAEVPVQQTPEHSTDGQPSA